MGKGVYHRYTAMDTPMTPVPSGNSRLSPQHLRIIALVAGAIAVVIIGCLAYRYWHGPSFLPAAYEVTVAADDLPLSPAYAFNTRTKEVVPFSVDAQGTAVVVDVARDDNYSYYLVSDPGFTSSNLYRQDRANEARGLETLTNSDTLKFDLSYDTRSGTVAYVAVVDGEKHIVAWSPVTKEEQDLGPGMHPTLLPGGFFVVLEREGKIVSVRIETEDEYEVLNVEADAPFAVDAENMKVVLYNPIVGMLQQFSIANSIGADYEADADMPVSAAPGELLYSEGAPVRAARDEATGELVISSGNKDVRIALPASLPPHYKLSIRHD